MSDSRQYALNRIKRVADNYTGATKESLSVKLEQVEDLRGSVSSILKREEELNSRMAKELVRKSIKFAFTNRQKPPNTYEKGTQTEKREEFT